MLFAWLFGVFVFAVLVGQVKEIIAQSTRSQDEYMKIFDNISQYMIRMKVSSNWFPNTTNCGLCRSQWRRPSESRPGASLRGTLRKVSTSERFSSIYPEKWWQTSPWIYISKLFPELSFSTAVIPASWKCWSVNWSQSSSCLATTFARKYWPFTQ